MKKLAVLVGMLMVGTMAMAANYGDYAPFQSGTGKIEYSPRNFTVVMEQKSTREAFSTNRLVLSGGVTSTYTTAECERVIVYRRSGQTTYYDPTSFNFDYHYPTLEVTGATFNVGDAFRVEFLSPNVATRNYAVTRTVQPTKETTVTLPSASQSIWIKNSSATYELWANIDGTATNEALMTTEGYSLLFKPGEEQSFDIRTLAVYLLGNGNTCEAVIRTLR